MDHYVVNSGSNYLGFMSKRKRIKEEIINFLFPIRTHHSLSAKLRLLILIGFMIAMKLVIGIFSIRIYTNFSISFSWIPICILGWHIGPVFSFFAGVITNTLTWIMSGSVWFWMFAIQTPLAMMINSVFGYIYEKRRNKKKLLIDYLFLQLTVIFFTFSTIYISISSTNIVTGTIANSFKIAVISVLAIFFIVLEVFLNYAFFVRKKNSKDLVLFIYVACDVIVNAFIFSFILGTITSIEYYRYLNHGAFSSKYEKYGFLFYIFPQVIKETIRLPLVIVITYTVQKVICVPEFDQLKRNAKIYW